LQYFDYSNNPIEYINPQIIKFLNHYRINTPVFFYTRHPDKLSVKFIDQEK
jgi:hypothetical protein